MLDAAKLESLLRGESGDPFAILGPHKVGNQWEIRALLPGARAVSAVRSGTDEIIGEFTEEKAGFFVGTSDTNVDYQLRIDWGSAVQVVDDPYRFGTLLTEDELWFLSEGSHLRPWKCFGAHPTSLGLVSGVRFVVWAPGAKRVSVVGTFNGWDGRRHMMRVRHQSGIWEIFVPGIGVGESYKYEIISASGVKLPLKADPYAFKTQMRPHTASVVTNLPTKPSKLVDLAPNATNKPISIYEVHLGSWMRREDGTFYSWEEFSDKLVSYVKEMGYTHIELLPVSEHPFDGSWGYQTLGIYSPTARFGDPSGFAAFVDTCHRANIAVIMDWVPAHFPKDEYGLARFTGGATYEYADPREGEHVDWGTYIYDFGKPEVVQYLVGNALYWAEVYGIDGLRVDAVASMLYRNYSRPDGTWIANKYGGCENLEAIAFVRRVNEILEKEAPGVLTFAEESTTFPKVSRPIKDGGLGFGYKWNMGWMNDMLKYMKMDPVYRSYHHTWLTFGMMYAYTENFVLPISHDEVVHGKASMIYKMPGDDWQKFANLRAFYAFMWAYPGKKLLFMGNDIAQTHEWRDNTGLDWWHLEAVSHQGVKKLIADLNTILKSNPSMYERDCRPDGFQWLTVDDNAHSVVAFARHGENPDEMVICISNFTPVVRENYLLGVPYEGVYKEILNTDSSYYWGSNRGPSAVGALEPEKREHLGQPYSFLMTLPPLSTVYLKWVRPAKKKAVRKATGKKTTAKKAVTTRKKTGENAEQESEVSALETTPAKAPKVSKRKLRKSVKEIKTDEKTKSA